MSNAFQELSRKYCYITDNKFSIELCDAFPDLVFVFGDNEDRVGLGGQAVIRDGGNSIGIRTKRHPNHSPESFWTDDDYKVNIALINKDISNIELLVNNGIPVVFSSNGYGNGLADLPTRAPKTYNYLITRLNEVFGTNY